MPENSISRRSLTKSAAWSVPVVAVAVAAPMAAASTTAIDLVVTKNCYDISLVSSAPEFTVTAASGNIPAGTTLTLTGANLALVTVASATATIGALSGSSRTITVGADTPSVTIRFTAILGVFVASNFTLAVASLPAGYSETNLANNSQTVRLTGAGTAFTGYTGLCNLLPILV